MFIEMFLKMFLMMLLKMFLKMFLSSSSVELPVSIALLRLVLGQAHKNVGRANDF